MIFDEMIGQLGDERQRVQTELEKIERAIRSLNDLKTVQIDRGIVSPIENPLENKLVDLKAH